MYRCGVPDFPNQLSLGLLYNRIMQMVGARGKILIIKEASKLNFQARVQDRKHAKQPCPVCCRAGLSNRFYWTGPNPSPTGPAVTDKVGKPTCGSVEPNRTTPLGSVSVLDLEMFEALNSLTRNIRPSTTRPRFLLVILYTIYIYIFITFLPD